MKRRPSPSMLVALSALVIALGGSAYAAGGLINGAKLKNGSVTGKKLKKHTLTAKQINVARLGKVPAARNADHATSADSATTAQTATIATNATHAASANVASTVGGIGPSGFVQGSGKTFSFSEQLSANTPSAKAFTIPGVGDVELGCSAGAQALITVDNGTGGLVDDSYSFETGVAGNGTAGGTTVTSNSALVSVSGKVIAQDHYMLAWPSGTHDHFAEISLGFYSTPASKCAVLISGVVR